MEARRTEQFGQTGAEGRDFEDQAGLSGSNWIMKKSGGIAKAFYFFGVPLNNIFEHLEATIGEAKPLYELCASVLQPASE